MEGTIKWSTKLITYRSFYFFPSFVKSFAKIILSIHLFGKRMVEELNVEESISQLDDRRLELQVETYSGIWDGTFKPK